jgi:hypothetical protein
MGEAYKGTAIWDRVAGYGFITDYYVAQTPYARFDPRIPRCSTDFGFTHFSVNMTQACRYTYNNPTLIAYSPLGLSATPSNGLATNTQFRSHPRPKPSAELTYRSTARSLDQEAEP